MINQSFHSLCQFSSLFERLVGCFFFFLIPLYPDGNPKFVFIMPASNTEGSARRYQWRVLPKGKDVQQVISVCQVCPIDPCFDVTVLLLFQINNLQVALANEMTNGLIPCKF